MALDISAVTFDCANAATLAQFWSSALGRSIDPGQEENGTYFASIGRADPTPGEPVLMFIQVPEAKTAKNRVHLDLNATDRAAEVERLVGLGATVVHDKDEWGVRWTTLTDPEGNEFCVATH
jgi:predicted enzyme related to lactoylglutathione lyase